MYVSRNWEGNSCSPRAEWPYVIWWRCRVLCGGLIRRQHFAATRRLEKGCRAGGQPDIEQEKPFSRAWGRNDYSIEASVHGGAIVMRPRDSARSSDGERPSDGTRSIALDSRELGRGRKSQDVLGRDDDGNCDGAARVGIMVDWRTKHI